MLLITAPTDMRRTSKWQWFAYVKFFSSSVYTILLDRTRIFFLLEHKRFTNFKRKTTKMTSAVKAEEYFFGKSKIACGCNERLQK